MLDSSKSTNQTPISTRKGIILIVDDNEYGRDILKRLLITKGYQLAFAANGIEALAKAAELTPDLILLDVMMPGMDGFEVCRRLRRDKILAEVPIILLTALDEPNARVQGLEAGADDFITKPFDRDELRARVQTIIRLNRFRRLLQERAKFEWVVENADEGYVVVDEDDVIIYANPRAQLYLDLNALNRNEGETSEKFLATIQQQYHCEPHEAWQNWPYTESDDPSRYLVRPESEVSPAFWLQVDIINLDDESSDLIVRLRDVTAQMNLERDMRGFHEMVRHKMSTPILLMLQNLEFLAKYATRMNGEQMAEAAHKALNNGQRLRNQVRDVLRYLDAPNIATMEGGFALKTLPPLIETLQNQLALQPIRLHGQNGWDTLQLAASERTIETILRELLENAKKFHPRKDPNIEITISQPTKQRVSIKVCDNGIHLSPEQLANVWSPYYQGEKYFTGEVGGMGLGLSAVSLLVRESSGQVSIKNRKGQLGVEVEFTLPAETQAT